MCGIVGAISRKNIVGTLLTGLLRLEYRGYDSAGLACLDKNLNELRRFRQTGVVNNLVQEIEKTSLNSQIGIAHTRWATHGKPSTTNAHPHVSQGEIAIVHNGIIDNHEVLRHELKKLGYAFESETDSELIAHYIHHYYTTHGDLTTAVLKTVRHLEGSFGIAAFHAHQPNRLVAVCNESPLVLGLGADGAFVASDQIALIDDADRFIYMRSGQVATLQTNQIEVCDFDGNPVQTPFHSLNLKPRAIDLEGYDHFMQKEIYQQTEVCEFLVNKYFSKDGIKLDAFEDDLIMAIRSAKAIEIVACGTSYHAALAGKYWLESLAGVPTTVEIASEYRHKIKPQVADKTLFVTISQSGETADTLAALRAAKELPYSSYLSICNVPSSTLVRESDLVLHTYAGVEIGVASTKAYMSQIIILMVVAALRTPQEAWPKDLAPALRELPASIKQTLALNEYITHMANDISNFSSVLFIGRGLSYPTALEGALKLQETSYIHAQGYPAGELKHGPLALIDGSILTIAIIPDDHHKAKMLSNTAEIIARNGRIMLVYDEGVDVTGVQASYRIAFPKTHAQLGHIPATIILQLIAYHTANGLGHNVDKPRNLAKSVTVE